MSSVIMIIGLLIAAATLGALVWSIAFLRDEYDHRKPSVLGRRLLSRFQCASVRVLRSKKEWAGIFLRSRMQESVKCEVCALLK